jgi:hypothetical protein
MRARAAKRSRAMSWPRTSIRPPLGTNSPSSMAIVVDLPAPLPPSSPTVAPRGTAKAILSTATVSP